MTSLPALGKSTNEQIIAYQSVLNDKLNNIVLPYKAVLCNTRICKAHHSEICEYRVIMSMIDVCHKTIPTTKPANKCKTVAGWNDYAKGYFDTSLFWHSMWVENDKPHNDIVTDLMIQTRAKYHHVCKMVLTQDAEIVSDKIAEAIVNNDNKSFWKQPKSFLPKKATHPAKVDDADGQAEIVDLFADTFHNLYNSVSYIETVMDILKMILTIWLM